MTRVSSRSTWLPPTRKGLEQLERFRYVYLLYYAHKVEAKTWGWPRGSRAQLEAWETPFHRVPGYPSPGEGPVSAVQDLPHLRGQGQLGERFLEEHHLFG